MAANRPPTKAERARVAELHAQGLSRNAIARDLGRSYDLVNKLCQEAGLTFDRSQTAEATRVRQLDLKARRAVHAERLQEITERLTEQVFAPTKIFNFGGKDNTYREEHVDQPPHADQLKIMQAVKLASDQSMRLEEFDSGRGVDAAKSLLSGLAEALKVTAAEHAVEDQADPA